MSSSRSACAHMNSRASNAQFCLTSALGVIQVNLLRIELRLAFVDINDNISRSVLSGVQRHN